MPACAREPCRCLSKPAVKAHTAKAVEYSELSTPDMGRRGLGEESTGAEEAQVTTRASFAPIGGNAAVGSGRPGRTTFSDAADKVESSSPQSTEAAALNLNNWSDQ